jgi:hypothetical protein
MFSERRVILSIGFAVAVWGTGLEVTHAQFGLRIQIGGSPLGVGPYGGPGVYGGGFNVPFGVGPSIPPSSRAYLGPQYQSGYRGYYGSYGVGPLLGYDSPIEQLLYDSHSNELLRQQYALRRQQMELQAAQRSLSAQQMYPYDTQSRYSRQAPRGSSSSSDLRPGMVLPDGSTVISVGPLSPVSSSSSSNVQPTTPKQPTVLPAPQANVLPSGPSEPKKAAF